MTFRRTFVQQTLTLRNLAGLVLLASVVYFPFSAGPVVDDLVEILVPLAVGVVLAVYTVRSRRGEYEADDAERIATYGWAGVGVGFVSAGWFIHQLYEELSVAPLVDEALTVVSVGCGIGVFAGSHLGHERESDSERDRGRLLAETAWTNEPGPNPILPTVVTQLAELEDCDPFELEPMYAHVDPNVFADLQGRSEAPWQLRFYRDGYEIRVSSQGTVTIYDAAERDEPHESTLSGTVR